jgi:tetratricopeptide (TPR) repeat protein
MYRKALPLTPEEERGAIHDNIAMIHGQAGDLHLSLHHYRESLRLDPDNSNAHAGIGSVRLIQGDLRSAKTHYAEALRLRETNFEACYNMGLVLERLGEQEEAIRYYSRFLELAPPGTHEEAKSGLRRKLEEWRRHPGDEIDSGPNRAP